MISLAKLKIKVCIGKLLGFAYFFSVFWLLQGKVLWLMSRKMSEEIWLGWENWADLSIGR